MYRRQNFSQKHAAMCQSWTRNGPMLAVLDRYRPGSGIYRHVYRLLARRYYPLVISNISSNRPISQIPQCIRNISHNASFPNRNAHMCTFRLQNGAFVGYGTGTLWDLWIRSMITPVFKIYQTSGITRSYLTGVTAANASVPLAGDAILP